MPNPVVHFEVIGTDAKKSQAFYADLFGWKVTHDEQFNYGIVDTGEQRGIQGGIGAAPDGKPAVRFYVEVDEPQAYLDKAQRMGAKTMMPVSDLGVITLAMFADPDGNVIGLIKS